MSQEKRVSERRHKQRIAFVRRTLKQLNISLAECIAAHAPRHPLHQKLSAVASSMCGDAEVDLGAPLSIGNIKEGAYVMAWVWVPREAIDE